MTVVDWLLDADPAIRWQVLQDLAGADAATIAAERARVARDGLAAELLRRQAPDGVWRHATEPDWLPTLFSMQLLRLTGVDPADARDAMDRLAAGYRWPEEHGARPFFDGEVEPCINGNTLAASSYFGRPSASLARRLVADQLPDGGWNCDAPSSTCASFHSTICVLEGLLAYERATGESTAAVRARAHEYLLERGLFRRRSTGEVIAPAFLAFAFPYRCYYDVLRALDYLRDAGVTDARTAEALRVVESRRRPDGRWLLDAKHAEAFDFDVGEAVGEPSRWNTLRALRVLRWYESS